MLAWYKSKRVLTSTIILSVIILDQASKAFVLNSSIPSACNTGFAFGIFAGFANVLIAILVLVAVVTIFTSEVKGSYTSEVGRSLRFWGLILTISGGASNILDRLIRGCVVDFIDLGWWPAFNLADAAISIGVFLLILSILFKFEAKNSNDLDH